MLADDHEVVRAGLRRLLGQMPEIEIVAETENGEQAYRVLSSQDTGGGGGMCPPLSNEVWVYSKDDDTLFRLITLGTDELQKQGYTRKGGEGVVGPMVPFHALIKTEDELWKIITFIRSVNPSSLK